MGTRIFQQGKRTSGSGYTSTFTWSGWIKRAELGAEMGLFSFTRDDNAINSRCKLYLKSNDQLGWEIKDSGGSDDNSFETNMVLRDTTAWYHIVFNYDSTDSTEADRLKLWVNGVNVRTDGGGFAAINECGSGFGSLQGTSTTQYLGAYKDNSSNYKYFDGCMADVYYAEGTTYAASVFGQTDDTTGEWKPRTVPSVTIVYGEGGYHHLFENSANLDLDSGTNTYTFSTSGTALTQTEDNPSNNFATLNSLANHNGSNEFQFGATEHYSSTNWLGAVSTLGANKGKFYAEAKITDKDNFSVGIIQSGGTSFRYLSTANLNYIGKYADGWGWNGNGSAYKKANNDSQSNYGSAASTNDIFMVAFDADNGAVYLGKNGAWFDSSNPTTSQNPMYGSLTFTQPVHFASGSETGRIQWNFGNGYFGTTAVSSAGTNASGIGIFEYDVPTGYTALSTKGLNE